MHIAMLLAIYNRVDSERFNQSENGIRDRTLVDLYLIQMSRQNVKFNLVYPEQMFFWKEAAMFEYAQTFCMCGVRGTAWQSGWSLFDSVVWVWWSPGTWHNSQSE